MKFSTYYDDAVLDPPADPPAPPAPPPPPAKTFTQEQVNSFLKAEKEKARAEREKTIKELETLQQSVQMTEQQKQQMEQQIETLRTANMTAEEQARRAKEKLETDYKQKLEATEAEKSEWEHSYQNLKIGYEINTAAQMNGVLDNSVRFVEALLRPQTRLVPDVGDDGKPTHTAKVRFQDVGKDGKPVTVEYTIPEAIKRMKEKPEEYGNLFRATTTGGAGATSGSPGKKPSVNSMTTEEYMAARKANPGALGLL